jgi:hypothetical protein
LINQSNTICPSYIDDIGLIISGKTQKYYQEISNIVSKTAFSWADKNGIIYDGPKTELIHFDKRRHPGTDNNFVTLPTNNIIHPTTTVRWLEIWLDDKLSFKERIKIQTTVATRAYYALKSLATSQNGMSLQNLREIYIATITAVIDYGAEIWWQGNKSMIRSLEILQNKAILSILGAFRTTPIAALEAEAAIPPTEIRLNQIKRRYSMKLISVPEFHPLRRRCPDDFPTYYDTGRNQDDGNTYPWYLPSDNQNHSFMLDKILKLMTRWIVPYHGLETISYIHDKRWRSTTT